MIAPAARPPITPAPTAQPTQRASAVVGTAIEASAITPAAAKAVKVFCILSLPSCLVAIGPLPNADSQRHPCQVLLESKPIGTRAICRKFVTVVHPPFSVRSCPQCCSAQKQNAGRLPARRSQPPIDE